MAVLPFSPKASLPAAKAAAPDVQPCFQSAEGVDYARILEVLGNGKPAMGLAILCNVAARLVYARAEHPRYAEGAYEALGVIGAEFHKLEQAVEHESRARQEDEALNVIATCLRFLAGEDSLKE